MTKVLEDFKQDNIKIFYSSYTFKTTNGNLSIHIRYLVSSYNISVLTSLLPAHTSMGIISDAHRGSILTLNQIDSLKKEITHIIAAKLKDVYPPENNIYNISDTTINVTTKIPMASIINDLKRTGFIDD